MRKHFLQFFLACVISVLFCADSACAQTPDKLPKPLYKRLDLVTIAEPTVRQHCRVVSYDEEKAVCRLAFGKTKAYLRSDLATVITPRENQFLNNWGGLPIPIAVEGGAIYGAIVVGSIPATAGLSAVALIFLPFVLWIIDDAIHPESQSHDTVIYQRSNTTLEVPLQ